MSFLDHAKVEQIGWKNGRALWMTLAPLRFGNLTVPAEFITDLASVPRAPIAWWFTGGRGTRSAILHDFPYQFGYWLYSGGRRVNVRKTDADRVFYQSLLADPISGCGPTLAWMMYQAVRVGGRGVWSKEARTRTLNPEWSQAGWIANPVEGV